MKRLPFIICCLLLILWGIAGLPVMAVVWLLGGNNPFATIIMAFSDIVDPDQETF